MELISKSRTTRDVILGDIKHKCKTYSFVVSLVAISYIFRSKWRLFFLIDRHSFLLNHVVSLHKLSPQQIPRELLTLFDWHNKMSSQSFVV